MRVLGLLGSWMTDTCEDMLGYRDEDELAAGCGEMGEIVGTIAGDREDPKCGEGGDIKFGEVDI